MKKVITLVFIMTLMLSAKDYTKNPETISFMEDLVQKYDFKRDELGKLFSNVKVQATGRSVSSFAALTANAASSKSDLISTFTNS